MINVFSDLVSRCSYKSVIDPLQFSTIDVILGLCNSIESLQFNDVNNGKLYILDLLKGSILTLEFLIRSVNLCKFLALCPDKLYPLFVRNILS